MSSSEIRLRNGALIMGTSRSVPAVVCVLRRACCLAAPGESTEREWGAPDDRVIGEAPDGRQGRCCRAGRSLSPCRRQNGRPVMRLQEHLGLDDADSAFHAASGTRHGGSVAATELSRTRLAAERGAMRAAARAAIAVGMETNRFQ